MVDQRGRKGARWEQIKRDIRAVATHCGICGQPIDTTLAWPDPQSFTVDHIIPLVLGGDPLDPDNLRPSHLSCNSADGARLTNHHRKTGSYLTRPALYVNEDY